MEEMPFGMIRAYRLLEYRRYISANPRRRWGKNATLTSDCTVARSYYAPMSAYCVAFSGWKRCCSPY